MPPSDESARGGKPVLSLRQKAMRALARRDHSRVELARKLERGSKGARQRSGDGTDEVVREGAGDGADTVDTVLDEFEANGWLSDERYAGIAARQRQGRFSRRHIVEDLKAKGVAAATAQTAVAALEQDDEATALVLWRQRFGQPPADAKEKARQIRFLQARGFSLSTAFRVLKLAGTRVDDEHAVDE